MDIDILHELFEYRDGALYWKIHAGKCKAGARAGFVNPTTGRRRICIKRKLYSEHRIIFAMHFGFFPEFVDHIDLNPLNNKIENLRQATKAQNFWNIGIVKRNTSGIKNVTWDSARNKWRVRVRVNGKRLNFGSFEDKEFAELVAIEARNKYHGEFCRHA